MSIPFSSVANVTVNRIHNSDEVLVILVAQVAPAFASHGRYNRQYFVVFGFSSLGQVHQKFSPISIRHASFGKPFLRKQVNNSGNRRGVFGGHFRNRILADARVSIKMVNHNPLIDS